MPASKTSKTKTTSTKAKSKKTTSAKSSKAKDTKPKTEAPAKKTTKDTVVSAPAATSLNPEIMAGVTEPVEDTVVEPTPKDAEEVSQVDEGDTVIATKTMSIDQSVKAEEKEEVELDDNKKDIQDRAEEVIEKQAETIPTEPNEASDTHETFFAKKPEEEAPSVVDEPKVSETSEPVPAKADEGDKEDKIENKEVAEKNEASEESSTDTKAAAIAGAAVAAEATTSAPLATTPTQAAPVTTPTPVSPIAEPVEKPKVEAKVDISGAGNDNGKDVYEMKIDNKGGNTKKIIIVISLVLLLLLMGGVYYYFNNRGDVVSPLWSGEETQGEDMTDNKSSNQFENPINGLLYSNAEAAEFKDRKPVAVMVNNTSVARPSSGLSKADIIYEAVAEGGITRLMPIFYSKSPDHVSSIRSARYYFVELASAYSPHYIHWGAAYVPDCQLSEEGCSHGQIETQPDVDAKARIIQLGVPNIDAGGYETDCNMDNDNCFVSRDPERVETMGKLHAGFVNFDQIFKVARDMRPEDSWNQYTPITEWKFKDDAPKEERGNVGASTPITYSYWETMPDFNVKWVYNPETNTYLRYQGGQKQVDMETGEDLEGKVVIVRYTNQEPANDYKNHLRHDIVGTGDALIFQDGEVTMATWTRSTHDERDIYTDENGEQIEFVRGQIWVQLVPTGNQVDYGQPTLTVVEADKAVIEETEEVDTTE